MSLGLSTPTQSSTDSSHAPARATARSSLVLIPARHHHGWSDLTLPSGTSRIGSGADCEVQLAVAGVAEFHAAVHQQGHQWVLTARDRRTWINGFPVREQPLRDRDRIAFGPLEFELRIESAAPPHDLPEPSPSSAAPTDESQLQDLRGELTLELDRLQSDVAHHEQQLRESIVKQQQADAQLTSASSHLTEQRQALADLDSHLQSKRAELIEAQQSLEKLHAEAVELRDDNDRRRERHNQQAAAIERQLAEAENRSRELQRKHDHLAEHEVLLWERERSLAPRESELQDREQQLLACEKEHEQRNAELTHRGTSLDLQQREIDRQKQLLEEQRRELADLVAATTAQEAHLARMSEERELQRRELAAERQELANREAALSAAEGNLAAQQQILTGAWERCELEQEEYSEQQQSENARPQKAEDEFQAECERIRRALELERQELNADQKALADRQRQIEQRAAETERTATERLKQLDQWQDRLASLERELSNETVAAQESQKQVLSQQVEIAERQAEVTRREAECERQQAELQQAHQMLADRQEAMQREHERLASLGRQLDEEREQLEQQRGDVRVARATVGSKEYNETIPPSSRIAIPAPLVLIPPNACGNALSFATADALGVSDIPLLADLHPTLKGQLAHIDAIGEVSTEIFAPADRLPLITESQPTNVSDSDFLPVTAAESHAEVVSQSLSSVTNDIGATNIVSGAATDADPPTAIPPVVLDLALGDVLGSPSASADDDEAIAQYMEQLLVRTKQPEPPSAAAVPPPTETEPSDEKKSKEVRRRERQSRREREQTELQTLAVDAPATLDIEPIASPEAASKEAEAKGFSALEMFAYLFDDEKEGAAAKPSIEEILRKSADDKQQSSRAARTKNPAPDDDDESLSDDDDIQFDDEDVPLEEIGPCHVFDRDRERAKLRALRQLANASAQHAISMHSRKTKRQSVTIQLTSTLVAGGLSAALLTSYLWAGISLDKVGWGSLGIAMVCAVELVRVSIGHKTGRKFDRRATPLAEPQETSPDLPDPRG